MSNPSIFTAERSPPSNPSPNCSRRAKASATSRQQKTLRYPLARASAIVDVARNTSTTTATGASRTSSGVNATCTRIAGIYATPAHGLVALLSGRSPVSSCRAGRREAASSVAPVSSGYSPSRRPCVASTQRTTTTKRHPEMSAQQPLYCYRHPNRETLVSCSECGRPICEECMTFAPVGIRCPEHSGKPLGTQRLTKGVRRAGFEGTGALVTKALIAINVAVYLLELDI